METQFTQRPGDNFREGMIVASPPHQGAVAWCAVFAGAVASAALSLILLLLGTGLGLTLVSPWANEGISGTSFGISSILGITVISLLASAIGGYIAGRLRTRWLDTPSDEVFFRDTAHGFLSWSVATLGTAALLTSVIGTIVGGGVKAAATVAGNTAAMTGGAAIGLAASNNNNGEDKNGASESGNMPMLYLLDSLLRNNSNSQNTDAQNTNAQQTNNQQADNQQSPLRSENSPDATAENPSAYSVGPENRNMHHNIPKAEIARIFMNAIATGSLPENDLKYTAQIVARSANIDQQTAEKRVADTFAALQTKLQEAESSAREAADTARELSAKTSLWLFISLLIGAFVASLMAVYGGRQRDL